MLCCASGTAGQRNATSRIASDIMMIDPNPVMYGILPKRVRQAACTFEIWRQLQHHGNCAPGFYPGLCAPGTYPLLSTESVSLAVSPSCPAPGEPARNNKHPAAVAWSVLLLHSPCSILPTPPQGIWHWAALAIEHSIGSKRCAWAQACKHNAVQQSAVLIGFFWVVARQPQVLPQ